MTSDTPSHPLVVGFDHFDNADVKAIDWSEIEEKLIAGETTTLKIDLAQLRRKSIAIRRYMSPQRKALRSLYKETSAFFPRPTNIHCGKHSMRWSGSARIWESVRDRAQLVFDQFSERRAEEMNRRLLVLAIISSIFLPLGFVTGLFGVNVGGMPSADDKIAFGLLCAGLGALAVGLLVLFRR